MKKAQIPNFELETLGIKVLALPDEVPVNRDEGGVLGGNA